MTWYRIRGCDGRCSARARHNLSLCDTLHRTQAVWEKEGIVIGQTTSFSKKRQREKEVRGKRDRELESKGGGG